MFIVYPHIIIKDYYFVSKYLCVKTIILYPNITIQGLLFRTENYHLRTISLYPNFYNSAIFILYPNTVI